MFSRVVNTFLEKPQGKQLKAVRPQEKLPNISAIAATLSKKLQMKQLAECTSSQITILI
jgi:hypothetical protein